MPVYTISVVEGDNCGPELAREGKKVLGAVEDVSDLRFYFANAPAGGMHYVEMKREGHRNPTPFPYETLETFKQSDAVMKAPVGLSEAQEKEYEVPKGLVEQGFILPARQEMGQYVNLRPTKVYPELVTVSHMKPEYVEGLDFVVVRENSEGAYSRVGGIRGRVKHPNQRVVEYLEGLMKELNLDAIDASCYTQNGVDRILRYAFDLAKKRRGSVSLPDSIKRVVSADKANVLYTSQFWRERFNDIRNEYPELSMALESVYIDAQHANLVRRPREYDVIVTDNLFGDILTDLATELTGSLGLGGSGNINPDGVSMFEPIHGSAPDIAGKGIANPIGMIFAAKLMLETLGHYEEARIIEESVVKSLRDGYRTKDIAIGGKFCSTEEMGSAVADNIRRSR